MYLKSGVLVLFLIIFRTIVIASPDACGASQQGEVMQDFHGGHSYASYEIDPQYMKEDSLYYQDRFCTKNGSGTIVQITSVSQKEDISIEVSNDRVVVQLMKNEESKHECTFTLDFIVSDGVNYLIETEIIGKKISITLFRRYTKISSLTVEDISSCLEGKFSSFTFLEKGGENIQRITAGVAPLHRGKPALYGDFDGCIGDSMLNGIPVNKAGTQTEWHDVDPSCTHNFGPECTALCATSYVGVDGESCTCPGESEINHVGLCVQSCNCIPCKNGGICNLKPGSDTICDCPSGYEGKYCENENPCKGFDCLNGGSCTVQPNGPSCTCLPNFSGIHCEVSIPEDPCDEVPCENNATCEHSTKLEKPYFCSCLAGYSGEHCEHQEKSDAERIHLTGLHILGICFGVLLLVVVAIVVVIVYLKQGHPERNGEESPDSSSKPEEHYHLRRTSHVETDMV